MLDIFRLEPVTTTKNFLSQIGNIQMVILLIINLIVTKLMAIQKIMTVTFLEGMGSQHQ